MKLRKKLLILTVIMTLLGTMLVFAEKSPQHLAAEELVSLSVLAGNDAGELLLDQTVTRAEMVVIVCRLLALEDTAVKNVVTASVFSDVPANHWAAGYLDIAKSQGIVNGYPDGTFRPDGEVSYAEVLKMLTAACGYLPKAESFGGYPMGVMMVAAQNGITNGISFMQDAPATRGDVACFTLRTLDLPLLFQTGFGASVEYQVDPEITLRNRNFKR
ncbi:MAG: S-layer homology domain-containing protein [Clostridia bacterium]|nr:S-layer homology domain-containing protein [Clostridia bacterium]